MKQLNSAILLLTCILLLGSCGSANKCNSSSIQKRKYTKGFFIKSNGFNSKANGDSRVAEVKANEHQLIASANFTKDNTVNKEPVRTIDSRHDTEKAKESHTPFMNEVKFKTKAIKTTTEKGLAIENVLQRVEQKTQPKVAADQIANNTKNHKKTALILLIVGVVLAVLAFVFMLATSELGMFLLGFLFLLAAAGVFIATIVHAIKANMQKRAS